MTSEPRELLRQLFQATESLRKQTIPEAELQPHLVTDAEKASLSGKRHKIPSAPSIEARLSSLDLGAALIDKLSAQYQTHCEQLRQKSQRILDRACDDMVVLPRQETLVPLSKVLSRLAEAHTTAYAKAVKGAEETVCTVLAPMLKERCLQTRSQSSQQTSPRSLPQDRRVSPKFNYEFTPYLQQYFAHNAFPSPAERAEMARKSGMEARQIEVWFQNHRRRARQEGQTLRRVQPSSRGLSPTELDEKMDPAFVIPEERRLEIDDEAEEVGTSSDEETDSSVSSPAASHAGMEHNPLEMVMPTRGLAPRRTYETMDEIASSGRTWSFAPPTWAVRAPAPKPSPAPSISALTAAFARLTVWDVGRSAGARFCLPTAYTPPRAPLPAFVRAANKFAPHPVQSCVARTTECCVAAAGPRATGTATGTTKSKKSKKVSGPPRRTPTRSSRSASPAWSERSESGYSSSASRTPSLSVSRRSSSSDLSSMPGTPPSGPLPLPFSVRFGGTEKA
ncbi:unnamed protein product [Mycena citricolor]|uniref:Homeobox domain-containing protein n=1 Tax=Mycena citricolor TaxID=2018698 RepID=A0AAD2Q149_9AGAR|nr:unnamed protein product [Mycena citricolor]